MPDFLPQKTPRRGTARRTHAMTSKPRLLVHTSRQAIRWADMVNDRKYADGTAKRVWIDLASGRSVPLPDTVASRVRDHR